MNTASYGQKSKTQMVMRSSKITFGKVFILFAAHVLLGLLANRLPIVSTVHAYFVLSLGLVWAATSARIEKVVYVLGYIVGAEVLWRMTNGPYLLWEFGKYSCSLILLVAILRRGVQKPFLPFLYFLLLIPSVIITFVTFSDMDVARKAVSFNLSGPLSLTLFVLFFSKVRLLPEQLHQLFIYIIAPIISMATIAGYHTYSAEDLYFTTASLFSTSGGFAPNQVSSLLGLGAFFVFFFLVDGQKKRMIRLMFYGVGFFLAVQCALTFSRGGLYCAGGAAILASFYLVTNKKVIVRYIFTIILLAVGAFYVAIPKLVEFTGGAIVERFQETSLTNRGSILQDDLRLWKESVLFGVGAGRASFSRSEELGPVAAHTEFSRLVAEHGMFGLFSLLALIAISIGAFRKAKNSRNKALTVAMLGWAFLFMFVNAIRLVAPAFAFGLAMITVLSTENIGKSTFGPNGAVAIPVSDKPI